MNLREWQSRVRKAVKEESHDVGELFAPERAPSLESRLAVYRHAFWARLSGSLREDFPLTERLIGKPAFASLVRDFLSFDRGRQADLGEVSAVFADFALGRGFPATVRRALQLDLLATEARVAPVAVAPGENFGLCPSARLLEFGPRSYAVWRGRQGVERRRIRVEERRLLACFTPAAPLSELTERLGRIGAEAEFVQNAVACWTRRGLIVDCAAESQ